MGPDKDIKFVHVDYQKLSNITVAYGRGWCGGPRMECGRWTLLNIDEIIIYKITLT